MSRSFFWQVAMRPSVSLPVCIFVLGLLGATSLRAEGLVTPSWGGLAETPQGDTSLGLHVKTWVHPVTYEHTMELGISGAPASWGEVVQVEYQLLPERLDPKAWSTGEGVPDVAGKESVFAKERGDGLGNTAFLVSRPLTWLPAQVVALAKVRKEGQETILRLGPFQSELVDPSLRVALQANYVEVITPSEEGLQDLLNIDSLRLNFVSHPERRAALQNVKEVAVGIGRPGEYMNLPVAFDRWTIEELRETGYRLILKSLSNRRGRMTADYGDARDFLWVLVIGKDGSIESYATWRPRVLTDKLGFEGQLEAQAPEILHAFSRSAPSEKQGGASW